MQQEDTEMENTGREGAALQEELAIVTGNAGWGGIVPEVSCAIFSGWSLITWQPGSKYLLITPQSISKARQITGR